MVQDAESNAEEDKKFEDLVQARNAADTLVHGCKKTLDESAEKVEASEKENIEKAISELEEVLKGEDKEEIEQKTKSLADASSSLAQRLYAEQQQESQAANQDNSNPDNANSNEEVVDADFEEVKEEKS
jgi:molecular chaperone DnaK